MYAKKIIIILCSTLKGKSVDPCFRVWLPVEHEKIGSFRNHARRSGLYTNPLGCPGSSPVLAVKRKLLLNDPPGRVANDVTLNIQTGDILTNTN